MKSQTSPIFSVVIPTYHRNEDLSRCLDQLLPGKQKNAVCIVEEEPDSAHPIQNSVLKTPCSNLLPEQFTYEVIVTDDGTDSTSKEMLAQRYSFAKWVEGKHNGPAGNRNAGVAEAKGKWIAFVDDDCIPNEDWLCSYWETIKEDSNLQVIEGRIYVDRPRRTLAEGAPINEDGGLLWTSNLCVNKSFFYYLGGFNERFRYAYEDVDFAYRIKQEGEDHVFCKEAAVCHPWRHNVSSSNNWKKKGYALESLLIYLELHPELRSVYTPIHFLKHGLRGFVRITLPGLIKYRMRGIGFALSNHLISLKTAWVVMTEIKKK